MIGQTSIRNPDFYKKQENLDYLREIAIEGEDAEAVLKYAARYLDQVEKHTLEILETGNEETIQKAVTDYRVVKKFCAILESAAVRGRRKQDKLSEIARNR